MLDPASLRQGQLYVVTEYVSKGSVRDLVSKHNGKVPEDLCWRILIQATTARCRTDQLAKQTVPLFCSLVSAFAEHAWTQTHAQQKHLASRHQELEPSDGC